MAATGKTPILLYGSTTATNTPVAGNLTNSSDGCEIAINVADKNLFFKDSTNTVNTVPIRQSSGSSDGWLSSANWTTFNSKQAALVSGTNIKTVNGTTLLGSGDLGTIGVGYGGTGTSTAFTLGSVVFAGSSGVYTQDNTNFFWDNTNKRLGIQTATPSYPLQVRRAGGAGSLGISSDNAWGASTRDALYYAVGDSTSVATGHAFYTRNGSATDVLVGGFDGPGNLQVKVGNVVIGTSGKGIDFSATSDGSGTATSELLADYEEGTWTVTRNGFTETLNGGSITSTGTYTKIGRQVFVTAIITPAGGATILATSGIGSYLSGLPYVPSVKSTGLWINAGSVAAEGGLYVNTDNNMYLTTGWGTSAATFVFSATYTT